ncbi:hypothetical protein BDV09DRAFT_205219 [Aspergillus tetrazonus]
MKSTVLHGLLPIFTRVLNARDIMSNKIPGMRKSDKFPYCIWYPETATEATENQQWEIYDTIMKADIRYNAMDDYTRTVFSQPIKGHLNGDTAVRAYLDIKTKFKAPPDLDNLLYGGGRRTSYFDITEDNPINARFITNSDLSRIMPETKHLPYCIWDPSVPHRSTCKELFRRVPSMKPAIARACILADYPETWDLLDADPDENLMMDAQQSHNPKYLRDLESKIPTRGCRQFQESKFRVVPRHRMFEYTSIDPITNVSHNPCADYLVGVPYNGRPSSMAQIELTPALPGEIKKLIEELWERDYTTLTFNDEYYASLENKGSQ